MELTAAFDALLALLPEEESDGDVREDREDTADTKKALTLVEVPSLPAVTYKLAGSLRMGQQIVLYGPPGTGKTYLVKKVAEYLVGDDPSRTQLVQFHPSYSYEDFFEGLLPSETASGQATFTVQPGPLRDMAADAIKEDSRGVPVVLIIDELNCANLAKVFGELYFLLEYRNDAVRLQYRPTEAFRLPRNLFIIGTMNTADRSIAFVEPHPTRSR